MIIKMLEIIPESVLDQENIEKITKLVSFPDKKVREEVGQFLMVISDEIDDPSSIMEIQRFNKSKIENDPDMNFTLEPRKSKK